MEASIPHATAASLMPPGTYVWQRRNQYAWGAWIPPRPRISEPWGSDQGAALHRIVQRAWSMHLQLEGKGWEACPYVFGAD